MEESGQQGIPRALLFVSRSTAEDAVKAANEGARMCGFPNAVQVFHVEDRPHYAEEWDVVAVPTLILHRPPRKQRRLIGRFTPEAACQTLDMLRED